MVLARHHGGVGGSVRRGAPPAPPAMDVARHAARADRSFPRGSLARVHRCDHGSQTIELALLLPVLALLMLAVLQAGLVASELVLAQAAARDAVRVASVDDDAAAKEAAQAVAGDRALVLEVSPRAAARHAGDLVTVTLRLRSAVLDRIGVEGWFPAKATMRVEWP